MPYERSGALGFCRLFAADFLKPKDIHARRHPVGTYGVGMDSIKRACKMEPREPIRYGEMASCQLKTDRPDHLTVSYAEY